MPSGPRATFQLDGDWIFLLHTNGDIEIKERNGATYTYTQTINEGSLYIYDVAISSDQKYFAFGADDNLIRVYENIGGVFLSKQTIAAGRQVYRINFLGNTMEVHGWGLNV